MCEIFNAEKMISKKLNKFVILQNRVVFSMILDSNVIVFSFLHSKKKETVLFYNLYQLILLKNSS